MSRLKFSFKETGRLTLSAFLKFYENYQNLFDLEMALQNTKTTYKQLKIKVRKSEEWF